MFKYIALKEFKRKQKAINTIDWYYCVTREPYQVESDLIPNWITLVVHREISINVLTPVKSTRWEVSDKNTSIYACLLYTSPSPRDS